MRLKISRICIPTDFSRAADHAVRYAAALARSFEADLHLLHVLEHSGQLALHPDFTRAGEQTRDYLKQMEQAAAELPESTDAPQAESTGNVGPAGQYAELMRAVEAGAIKRIESADEHWWSGLNVVRDVRYGHPVKEINDYVANRQIDLVVIGSHGHSKLASLLLGSVTERVVKTCGCPVVVVRHPEHHFEVIE